MVKIQSGSARVYFYTRYSQALWKHRDALGVSATHLDWTMVPYVRKTFYKHLQNGFKYVEKIECIEEKDFDPTKQSIEDYPKTPAYKYAMDMTIKECQQAVEGMYHNLNY